MPSLDVFAADAFTMTSLVAKVDQIPFVPGAAGKLGIFDEEGTYTTTLEVEERAGGLYLIPNTQRGAPAVQNTRDKRKLRLFKHFHFPVRDYITADEIQNKRAFGSETDLQMAEMEVQQRMMKMTKSLDATVEYGRIGALQGVILDSDGATTLYNLFTEFGVTQTTVDFLLGTSTTNVIGKCETVRAAIQDVLGADGSEDIQVTAFVGKTFFDELITHPNVVRAYQYYQTLSQAQNPLQQDIRYTGFKFGGILFKVYRGSVSGIPFIPAAQGTAFPVGVPDIYATYFAPGDYMETANTLGRPRYAKMAPDPSGFNKFWAIEMQSSPISLCLRPGVLVALTTSN